MPFECAECGYTDLKWLGRCPRCMEWNSLVEVGNGLQETGSGKHEILKGTAQRLSDIETTAAEGRKKSGWKGIDRLLGGGFVDSEVILVGGPPGVGKSTLFIELAGRLVIAGIKVLFVSGEENPEQMKIHAGRLKVSSSDIIVLGSGDLDEVEKSINKYEPDVVFIDSVQAMADPAVSGVPGSMKQVKSCGQRLTSLAKNSRIVMFISGQITKQGDIAGPKVLEHMVDAVVYMDSGEGNMRILSAVKNRFGACGDFVLYYLSETGLEEIEDSDCCRSADPVNITGQSAACVRTGSRLISAEFQVLSAKSYFEYPLRRTSGFSRERLLMINAIAEKHLGLKLASLDIYINVSGGRKVTERAGDLGMICALYSSVKNVPVSQNMIFTGEVGLNGEIRSQQDIAERVKYAERSGFSKAVIPAGAKIKDSGIKLVYINNISQLDNIILK
ncbi:MAG: ATPase domain-containing protein [Elusimicrobiota bacterium]